MRKYFYLQSKRLLRFLPGAICAALVLLGGLLAIFSMLVQQTSGSEENQRFQIAIAGYIEDPFLQMGLSALEAFDSTRFSLEIRQMEEDEAAKALAKGDIAAYVVVPEGFVDAAMGGQLLPLKFVSTTGAAGLVSIFKDEITSVISTLLLDSQKGVFGMWDAMYANGLSHKASGKTDELALVYVDYIFARDHIYSLQELGIADQLGLESYLLCGFGVLFLLLACLPFAPLMIRRDPALGKLLCAKGKPAFFQALCDFVMYALALSGMLAVLLLAVIFAAPQMLDPVSPGQLFLQTLPVLLMVAAFSFMLYALSSDLIGGILLQFFVTLAMCFVSGCMYPVYFFPAQVQKLAAWLPAGIARTQLAGCVTGNTPEWTVPALLGCCVLFFAVGSLARIRQIQGVRP